MLSYGYLCCPANFSLTFTRLSPKFLRTDYQSDPDFRGGKETTLDILCRAADGRRFKKFISYLCGKRGTIHQYHVLMSKIVKPVKKSKTIKDILFDLFAIWVLIFYASIHILPFAAVAGILYLLTKGVFFLILTIILIIAYIGMIIYGIKECRKPYDPANAPISSGRDDSDEAAETAALLFGAGLLGHHIGKHRASGSDNAGDD